MCYSVGFWSYHHMVWWRQEDKPLNFLQRQAPSQRTPPTSRPPLSSTEEPESPGRLFLQCPIFNRYNLQKALEIPKNTGVHLTVVCPLLQFFLYFSCLYFFRSLFLRMCVHVCVHSMALLWRSEDNCGSWFSPSTRQVMGTGRTCQPWV